MPWVETGADVGHPGLRPLLTMASNSFNARLRSWSCAVHNDLFGGFHTRAGAELLDLVRRCRAQLA